MTATKMSLKAAPSDEDDQVKDACDSRSELR